MTVPRWTDDQVGYLVDVAWDGGRAYEHARIATAAAELDATWQPVGRRTYERQVADRIAEMERYAARQTWSTWRGRYPGGPVDYETGRLRVVFTPPGRAA